MARRASLGHDKSLSDGGLQSTSVQDFVVVVDLSFRKAVDDESCNGGARRCVTGQKNGAGWKPQEKKQDAGENVTLRSTTVTVWRFAEASRLGFPAEDFPRPSGSGGDGIRPLCLRWTVPWKQRAVAKREQNGRRPSSTPYRNAGGSFRRLGKVLRTGHAAFKARGRSKATGVWMR